MIMNDKQMLTTAIQFYLASRPEAEDTLERIHGWWRQWSSLEESQAVTLAALEGMEAEGFLERAGEGNREVWRRPY